jgi:hypothetical protein
MNVSCNKVRQVMKVGEEEAAYRNKVVNQNAHKGQCYEGQSEAISIRKERDEHKRHR